MGIDLDADIIIKAVFPLKWIKETLFLKYYLQNLRNNFSFICINKIFYS